MELFYNIERGEIVSSNKKEKEAEVAHERSALYQNVIFTKATKGK